MAAPRSDRRARRSRHQLRLALLELLRKRPYDAITVQEIVDTADVGRSTFYAHFTDKDDLLVDNVRHLVGDLIGVDAGRGLLFPTLPLLHHVADQDDLYRRLARGRAMSLVLDAARDELAESLHERLRARTGGAETAVPLPLLATMVAGMLMTAIAHWVDGGLRAPAEELDHSFRTVASAALRAGTRVTGS